MEAGLEATPEGKPPNTGEVARCSVMLCFGPKEILAATLRKVFALPP